MIPELRRSYNAAFNDEKYRAYHSRLEEEAGCEIPFRLAETPVFLPPELRDEMVEASLEIWRQLTRPEALERSLAAVPAQFDVPGSGERPVFACTDFAVVRGTDGRLEPKLIELQGFPSLYAFQVFQSRALADMAAEEGELGYFLPGLDWDSYRKALGEAILAGMPPENVVLLDIDPPHQKTYVDFAFTEKLWGVRAVDLAKVEKRGRELWYERDGKPTRILRIYNRVIFDELAHKKIPLPFDLREPLDVSWAGHPNWYFRWSKHALPALHHPTVPEAHFLSDLPAIPKDPENWVLKPLFSFAGGGVHVDVTPADIDAVPPAERPHTLLMRKVAYEPCIETTDGNRSKVEVRILFIWKDGEPFPVTTLARLSQGKMMGVNFNKDRTWVGSSGCLWPGEKV
ncbi:MAG TPA: hypothetical protein VGQ32_08055 [Thermoanaerobaculia bacterium]|nr:hypothetical protein [Thermoanaerobaculia bacterium]